MRDGKGGQIHGQEDIDILADILGLHESRRACEQGLFRSSRGIFQTVRILSLPPINTFELYALEPHSILSEILYVHFQEYLLPLLI